ncbi:hypothetical protein [Haloarcula argentinensis]|uniref:Uncharacterized protein n=1 Tax=Haloarcula argentinensis TaxID=43776 RepID=A0A830FXE1_HALAR|nr:hypothetical protein [Haloarcula argentinensis]GGM51199.1 hypothetical protein GCM10009006_35450 [Haloarcula argentinensis]
MTPESTDNEFAQPEQSLSGRIAGSIETFCTYGARISIPLFLPVGALFITYLIGGYALILIGVWSPSYPFLSLTEDIYFAWLGFLSGAVICFGTGSLIGLVFLTEREGSVHNEVSILASFIGFGFGGAILRMTYATVLATIL